MQPMSTTRVRDDQALAIARLKKRYELARGSTERFPDALVRDGLTKYTPRHHPADIPVREAARLIMSKGWGYRETGFENPKSMFAHINYCWNSVAGVGLMRHGPGPTRPLYHDDPDILVRDAQAILGAAIAAKLFGEGAMADDVVELMEAYILTIHAAALIVREQSAIWKSMLAFTTTSVELYADDIRAVAKALVKDDATRAFEIDRFWEGFAQRPFIPSPMSWEGEALVADINDALNEFRI